MICVSLFSACHFIRFIGEASPPVRADMRQSADQGYGQSKRGQSKVHVFVSIKCMCYYQLCITCALLLQEVVMCTTFAAPTFTLPQVRVRSGPRRQASRRALGRQGFWSTRARCDKIRLAPPCGTLPHIICVSSLSARQSMPRGCFPPGMMSAILLEALLRNVQD